jgi:hypothetical protein
MKKLFILMVGIISMMAFNSCSSSDEEELTAIVSVDYVGFTFTQTSLYALPVLGQKDNCDSHTVVYSIDGTEIGRTTTYPYDLTHQFSAQELTPGTHSIKIVFNGQKSSGSLSATASYTLIQNYNIIETGELTPDTD